MAMPIDAQAMWSAYAAARGGVNEDRFYEAFSFGDSASMADELGRLVLAGTKRATAGAVWSYAAEGKPIPQPGDLSVVMDSAGQALCIIETTQVDIVPFDQVSAEFAATEGEGDGSLAYWRQVHLEYFTRECARAGCLFSHDMAIACERFKVVHPPAVRSAP
jgi:uncharacterized protein YhfF